MTKRTLTRIALTKIAAVDKPCQAHATIAIIKRAPDASAPLQIAKKTFDEALRAQLVSEKVGDVFWRAFENQWSVREAFRTAMTDEISEGGDGNQAVAGFTSAMEQIATLAADAAREAASTAEPDLEAAVEAAISKWLNQQEQTTMKIINKAQLAEAIAKFDPNTSPAAHVAIIQKAAQDLGETSALPAEGILAIVTPVADPNLTALQTEVTVLKMAPAIRKHYDALSATDQAAFLAKSDTDRAAAVDAIEKGDPIVYTCDDGTVIRKSEGDAAARWAKRSDEQDRIIKGLQGDTIQKRAKDEFPNVAQQTAVDMLKSATALGVDSDAGKSILATLGTMNKSSTGLFKSLGTSVVGDDGPGETIEKARKTFGSKVSEIQKRDSLGLADAMSKARDEDPDAYSAAYPAAAEADA